MSKRIIVIGLGNIGKNIAIRLKSCGFDVRGSDISQQVREKVSALGIVCVSPEKIDQNDVYLFSLPTSECVQEIIRVRPCLLDIADSGSLFIDTSTGNPSISIALAKIISDKQMYWVDAPVSGGAEAAKSGTLSLFLGGDKKAVEVAKTVLNTLSSNQNYMGKAGTGHVTKLANNLLCATNIIALAQASALAMRQGIDVDTLIRTINVSSGRSAVSEINFPKWILSETYDSGFSFALMRKDLKLAKELIAKLDMESDFINDIYTAWKRYDIDDFDDFNKPVAKEMEKAIAFLKRYEK